MTPTRSDDGAPSVAIIGSFRQHYGAVREAAEIFARAGFTVTSPPPDPLRDGEREHVLFHSDPPSSADHEIQEATFQKIFSADFVYVVDPGGYIGRTTAYELGHIHQRGMAVYFAEPPKDLPIEVGPEFVVSADELVAVVRDNSYRGPVRRPRVAALPSADIVIFTIRESDAEAGKTPGPRLHVLLIRRGKEPFRKKLALPGGFLRPGESLEEAARRELREETNLRGSFPLTQVRTFSKPGRDPRGRVVTTAFLAVAPNLPGVHGASDAARADWVEVHESMWTNSDYLAFDHGEILRLALEQARALLEQTTIALNFCPPKFTISDLRKVYEAVWGIPINPQNFQHRVREIKHFLVPAGEVQTGRPGRPAALFRRGSASVLDPPFYRQRPPSR